MSRGGSDRAGALAVVGTDQLGVRLRRTHHIEPCRRGLEIEGGPAYREQAEMMVVGPVALGRTRAAVTGLAEIVARLVETGGRPSCRIAGIETA